MSSMSNNPYESYATFPELAINAGESERVAFIRRTYLHLAAAVGVFALIEAVLLAVIPQATLEATVGTMISGWNWLIVLGAFMVVSWIARGWANSSASQSMQYAGLTLYVVGESVIFLPLLYLANRFAPGAIASAGLVTGVIFGGLTLVVFVTRIDFSFLRMFLWLGGLAAMGFIVASIFLPMMVADFSMLGLFFTCAMIVLASGYILYDTSNVLHRYRTDQHVAAALAL